LDERTESESHAGMLKPTEHETGEFFEFGGQKLLLRGTSGPPRERSRIAEGRPIRHDVSITGPNISTWGTSGASQVESRVAAGQPVQHRPDPQDAVHAGVLKPTKHETGEFFEFGGQKLLLRGTSGPPRERSRIAEGRPIRHDVSIAGRTIPAWGTSGASQVESRVAAGQPVQHRPRPQDAVLGSTGSGQLIGGPVRRA